MHKPLNEIYGDIFLIRISCSPVVRADIIITIYYVFPSVSLHFPTCFHMDANGKITCSWVLNGKYIKQMVLKVIQVKA